MTRSQLVAWTSIAVAAGVYVRMALLASDAKHNSTQPAAVETMPPPQVRADACTAARISVKDVNARLENRCTTRDCTRITGTATIVNQCSEAIGVEIKLTVLDASGRAMASKDIWPASVRNIPPGDYVFGLDGVFDYSPGMKSVEAEPVDVRIWR